MPPGVGKKNVVSARLDRVRVKLFINDFEPVEYDLALRILKPPNTRNTRNSFAHFRLFGG